MDLLHILPRWGEYHSVAVVQSTASILPPAGCIQLFKSCTH